MSIPRTTDYKSRLFIFDEACSPFGGELAIIANVQHVPCGTRGEFASAGFFEVVYECPKHSGCPYWAREADPQACILVSLWYS